MVLDKAVEDNYSWTEEGMIEVYALWYGELFVGHS